MSKLRTCKNCWHDYHCPARQEGLDLAPTCEDYSEV